MGLMRRVLLAGSESRWLRERAGRTAFLRQAVSRFMPGERLQDALGAAATLRPNGIGAVLTRLGENVSDPTEAEEVTRHYLEALEQVKADGADCEISVKLTQLGLDLDPERCYGNVRRLAERAFALANFLWIDMEQTRYTDATLALCRRARAEWPNVGVCVQSYLYRTVRDLASLVPTGIGIRLVKGAYDEPPGLAFRRKREVDENYLALARQLLGEPARQAGIRAVFGTHDMRLIQAIRVHATAAGLEKEAYEFHLLYGIQRSMQERLAREGQVVRVLISYGPSWFPWYMRRLAERPANVLFVVRNMLRR